jgi:hypothetical protein
MYDTDLRFTEASVYTADGASSELSDVYSPKPIDPRIYVTDLINQGVLGNQEVPRNTLCELLDDEQFPGQTIRLVFIEEFILYQEALLRDLQAGAFSGHIFKEIPKNPRFARIFENLLGARLRPARI